MYGPFWYSESDNEYDLNYDSMQDINLTFQALVDTIIPRSPILAEEFGMIQYYGALDLYTNEYMIWSLNHLYDPVAEYTGAMIEEAANIFAKEEGLNPSLYSGGDTFSKLDPQDRLRVLTRLLDEKSLPSDFQGSISNLTSQLNRLTMIGYYSEWSGYGTTRLDPPNNRRLEFYPLSWGQVSYPGPSLGYRGLRESYFV